MSEPTTDQPRRSDFVHVPSWMDGYTTGEAHGIEQAEDERDRLLALVAAQAEQIKRVRALHQPYIDSTDTRCCSHEGDVWPCPTITALDGEATP